MSAPFNYRDPIDFLAALGARAPSIGGMIVDGFRVPVPGDVVVTWLDSWCASEVTDKTRRNAPPRNITLHTTSGTPHDPPLSSGATTTNVCALANYQTSTARDVSWDFTVSRLGAVVQQNDPAKSYTWQAGTVNGYSIGIETEQGPGGAVYVESIQALVRLVDALTRAFGIQRQIPAVRVGGRLVPDRRVLARFGAGANGATWWGALGHRNVTGERGPGDPGDVIMQALLDAGYEGFDLATWEDVRVWQLRQQQLGVAPTGEPGPATVAALARAGFPHGIYVWRPGD